VAHNTASSSSVLIFGFLSTFSSVQCRGYLQLVLGRLIEFGIFGRVVMCVSLCVGGVDEC